MDIEGGVGEGAAETLAHIRAHGEIGHEVAVHDVKVEEISPTSRPTPTAIPKNRAAITFHISKVGGENGGGDERPAAAGGRAEDVVGRCDLGEFG
jgi:hypothetical protein